MQIGFRNFNAENWAAINRSDAPILTSTMKKGSKSP